MAFQAAFANPAAPTAAELNTASMVKFISCALTESNTSLVKEGSETDDEISFCSVGNEQTATFANFSAQLTGWHDANTGGSGSTVDLTSIFNQFVALTDWPDVPYYIISRTGAQGSQDIPFAIGQRIKVVGFKTDLPNEIVESGTTLKRQQNFLFNPTMGYAWNYTIAA